MVAPLKEIGKIKKIVEQIDSLVFVTFNES